MEQVKGETRTLLSHEAHLPGTHGPSTDTGLCSCLDRDTIPSAPSYAGGKGRALLFFR